jgi:hypothetical protein
MKLIKTVTSHQFFVTLFACAMSTTMKIAEQGPLNEPRAHLDGVDLPKNFSLPALALVRADAARGEFFLS